MKDVYKFVYKKFNGIVSSGTIPTTDAKGCADYGSNWRCGRNSSDNRCYYLDDFLSI